MRVLFLLLILWMAPLTAEALNFEEPLPPEQEQRAVELFKQFRCVVCTSESLYDSKVPLASDLRQTIRQLIREGKSNEEIKAYLVSRYGEEVLFKPPVNRNTWLLWAGPGLVLVFGVGMLWLAFRPNSSRTAAKK